MDQTCQRYLDNLAAARNLVKPKMEPGMTEEQTLQAIRDNAESLFWIHQENDEILEKILFSKEAAGLTEEEAAQLSELADALFNFNRSADIGVAYRIHRLLYEYAVYRNDTDAVIRELYYQGITLFYLNVRDEDQNVNLFGRQMGEYFLAGAAYMDQYEELTDPKTRGFILRCLGNMKYSLNTFISEDAGKTWDEYMDCYNRAMEVFQSPHYQELNPEIPWDTFIYTMHYDRTKFLSQLREQPDPAIAAGVLESAEYVYRHQEQIARANEKGIGIRTQYVYAAARYHAGRASIGELMKTLFSLCESADIHDFSGDNIWCILHTPGYLMRYAEELPAEERQALTPRIQKIFEKQREYLFLIPRSEYGLQVPRAIQNIVGYLSTKDTNFFRQILSYILACHPPTFVHSQVVALMTKRLCGQMAKVNPDALAGAFGYRDGKEINDNLEQVLDEAYQVGLYHDMGKCMLLNNVSLYSRKLLDEEFACIKMHPPFGCKLLEALQMEDIGQAAYFHHRTYDGKSGYPQSEKECSKSMRCIVDIVTVVDALDAGTDNVGRSYAAAKDYGRLIEELRAGKGTRYSPAVVELFDDPVFYEETRRYLDEKRREVYLRIYHGE